MKVLTDIIDANKLLYTYAGAASQIAFYSESLKRIAIRIILPTMDEVIYLVGVGCESINGRFSFPSAHLLIEESMGKEINEKITIISDKGSGFELITSGGFSLAQGTESEFGISFKDFFKEKN